MCILKRESYKHVVDNQEEHDAQRWKGESGQSDQKELQQYHVRSMPGYIIYMIRMLWLNPSLSIYVNSTLSLRSIEHNNVFTIMCPPSNSYTILQASKIHTITHMFIKISFSLILSTYRLCSHFGGSDIFFFPQRASSN